MAKWRTKSLQDAIDAGDFTLEPAAIRIDGRKRNTPYEAYVSIEDALIKHPIWDPSHVRCPGCGHFHWTEAIIDCRHITDLTLASCDGNKHNWMCGGCWTHMIFQQGKKQNLYKKIAAEVNSVGTNAPFIQKQSRLKDLVGRKGMISKKIDDYLDPISEVMPEASTLQHIDSMSLADPKFAQFSSILQNMTSRVVGTFMNQRKTRDGVLITKRSLGEMPISLWLELHNAPVAFVDKFKGKPKDFKC